MPSGTGGVGDTTPQPLSQASSQPDASLRPCHKGFLVYEGDLDPSSYATREKLTCHTMAAILANASQLKPDIRLAQAVSQFELDLSGEQKAAFRAYRSQALSLPPDPSDVMRLTAEIDRRALGKVGGRCFGPRFTSLLHVVQQFAALGDVVVGGSQNIIACGVWSLVRMSLLSIVSVTSYLEKSSTIFMNAGRSAPRYQAMALLYPRSKSLQSHLSEYFIVVVRLCHRLLKFTQKSAFHQVVSSLSDTDMNICQAELDLWANSIKEEVSLLMGKKIEEEAQENSRFRALSSKFSRSATHQQRLATKLRILELCSKYDHEMTWKQTRKVGNATLFNHAAEYQEWKGQTRSCTLEYTGKLGSGKSVLLANIVDDLNIQDQSNSAVVTYFFCRHDIPESLSARTVVGSLARQLLRTISDLPMAAELCDETSLALNFEQILSLLRRVVPPGYKVYFILDGLDECGQVDRETLVRQLQDLQEAFVLLICVSFRTEPNSALTLSSGRFPTASGASIPDQNPDIEEFIEAELGRCLESRELVLGDPAVILEIQDALSKGSQGMFLWVVLQIRSLCAMGSDQAIREALVDLPKDLHETFSRVLERSKRSKESDQERILQLVTAARRPLTVEELREALSVIPGDTLWNPSRLLNDIYSALSCCGCLLTVDEEELTVRFVHHSVKQFLLSDSKGPDNITFPVATAQKTMAHVIVTYLNYGVFGMALSTKRVPRIAVGSAPARIISSTLASSSNIQSLALKLLKSKRQPSFDIGKVLAEAHNTLQPRSEHEFHFFSYAKSHWLQHVLFVPQQDLAVYDLLLRMFQGSVVDQDVKDDGGRTPLWQAADHGHETVVKLLLDSGKVSPGLEESDGWMSLWRVAENGQDAIVNLLLQSRFNGYTKSFTKRTPLSWAAENGYETVVKLLLDSDGVDVNSKDSDGKTPLSRARENGHETVIKLLIETGQINVDTEDNERNTTLSAAAMGEHIPLYWQLYESLVTSPLDNKRFLPLDVLEKMITKENVETMLPSWIRLLQPGLPAKVAQQAKKIFAILVLIDEPLAIKELLSEGITDEHLPLSNRSEHSTMNGLISHDGRSFRSFAAWKSKHRVADFLGDQWLVLAPVIDASKRQITISQEYALPIMEEDMISESPFSTVRRGELHPAHQRGFRAVNGKIRVAIKEFKPLATEEFRREKHILENDGLHHPHLIRYYVTCENRDHSFIIFPWASGGDLRDFWKLEDQKERTAELTLWVLWQMVGLTGALEALHREGYRHGDLKPVHILHFNEDENAFLAIAGLGLAGKEDAITTATTPSYQAPEVHKDPSSPKSRRYDIWSLGCVLLEFVIWFLYDFEAIHAFDQARLASDHFSYYYVSIDDGKVEIHPKVTEAIEASRMDKRCRVGTPFNALLNLIEGSLLQVHVESRDDATTVVTKLTKISLEAESQFLPFNPGHHTKPQIFQYQRPHRRSKSDLIDEQQ